MITMKKLPYVLLGIAVLFLVVSDGIAQNREQV